MTKSEIFKAAHKIARVQMGTESYRARFAKALKGIYTVRRRFANEVEETSEVIEVVVEYGSGETSYNDYSYVMDKAVEVVNHPGAKYRVMKHYDLSYAVTELLDGYDIKLVFA